MNAYDFDQRDTLTLVVENAIASLVMMSIYGRPQQPEMSEGIPVIPDLDGINVDDLPTLVWLVTEVLVEMQSGVEEPMAAALASVPEHLCGDVARIIGDVGEVQMVSFIRWCSNLLDTREQLGLVSEPGPRVTAAC